MKKLWWSTLCILLLFACTTPEKKAKKILDEFSKELRVITDVENLSAYDLSNCIDKAYARLEENQKKARKELKKAEQKELFDEAFDINEVTIYFSLLEILTNKQLATLEDTKEKVWINAESEIKYPVVFGPDKREVFITGEAFFEVVKDSLRPFIVHTPNAQTTVLGTSFNVMAYPDERHTEITLLKGAVVVEAAGRNQYIKPGQQVQVDNVSKEMNCREVNAGRYASWKDGLFDFEGMKLEDLAVELSRWYDVDFKIEDRSAWDVYFTITSENTLLEKVLQDLEKIAPLRFEYKEAEKEVIVTRKKEDSRLMH